MLVLLLAIWESLKKTFNGSSTVSTGESPHDLSHGCRGMSDCPSIACEGKTEKDPTPDARH
ncbi:MAG: hypothetical protein HY220_00630 [Candidatus Sungbacteria bacterium]|uniref:Uncharacterized protein n=1 Tax=Candidatus Sungiibacteriota bacterium TaxID=2750080 RepID=A0A9D6LT62_9BACT|nr:hypothetical protein [Candidatus Sungbacteria bacterium]